MIGRQGSGDGALDLLAVQRDDEILDLLGARSAVASDDELVRLLVAWRDEVDDGLSEVVRVPAPRAAPEPARGAAAGTPASPAAAGTDRPGADLLPAAGSEPTHRRRLTAAGTAAAIVLGGTLSLSGVAAAVTGDPLAPYRAVGHAFSIGGDDLPEHAAEVAHLNKRLTRARAALAHGEIADVQAVVDQLTAELASADLTDEQRSALEHRLSSLQAAIARAAAAEAEKASSSARGKPEVSRSGTPQATPTTTRREDGDPTGTAESTQPDSKPTAKSDTEPTSRPEPTADAPEPEDAEQPPGSGAGQPSTAQDRTGGKPSAPAGADEAATPAEEPDPPASPGTARSGGGSTSRR